MPINPGGSPGGAPGGTPPGGSASVYNDLAKAIENLTDKEKEHIKSLLGMKDTYDHQVTSLIKTRKEITNLIKETKEELEVVGKTDEEVKQLTEDLKKLQTAYVSTNKKLDEANKLMKEETTLLYQLNSKFKEFSTALSSVASPINKAMTAFHSYNLEVQKHVQLSGQFVGNEQKGHDAFKRLRDDLNLSRDAAKGFLDTWSTGSRLGLTTKQLTEMAAQLKAVHGQAAGLKMMGTILQTPMTAANLQGVRAGDTKTMLRLMQRVNPEQAQAITGTLRTAGEMPKSAAEAARFENMQARVGKIRDDIKLGMEAGLNDVVGPEIAALMGPLSEIAEDVSGSLKSLQDINRLIKAGMALSGVMGMGGAGGGAGGLGKFMMGRGGAFGAGGLMYAGGVAAGEYAQGMQPGAAQTATGVAGGIARVGGAAMMGGAVANAPGAVAAGGLAAVNEAYQQPVQDWMARTFFGAITDESGKAITGAGPAPGLTDSRAEVFGAFNTNLKTLSDQISQTAADIAETPEHIASEVAMSGLQTALASVDPSRMFMIGEKASKAFSTSLDLGIDTWKTQVANLRKGMEDVEKLHKEKKIGDDEYNKVMESYNAKLEQVTNKNVQTLLEDSQAGKAAAGAMQRVDVRTGQIGIEREGARAEFQRTGAITGEMGAINKLQGQLTQGYEESLKEVQTSRSVMEKNLGGQRNRIKQKIEEAGLDEAIAKPLRVQLEAVDNQLKQNRRILNSKESTLKVEQMNADIEMIREKVASAEKSAVFRRAQWAQSLMKTQESLARERGASPEEIGGLAQGQADQAEITLNKFKESFGATILGLEEKAAAARAGGDEGKALLIEQEIFNYKNKGVELEKSTLQARIHAATAEEKSRQELIGANKQIAEINRDSAAKMGMNWRVQMAYQQEIIELGEQDLASKGAEIMKLMKAIETDEAAGKNTAAKNLLLKKEEVNYAQKQASLIEAKMGKQRSFLEQSTAASFGVGAGSRILPVINQRMFGQMVQGVGGLRMPGQGPRFEQQQRRMMGGGGIFGGIEEAIPGRGGKPGGGGGEAAEGVEKGEKEGALEKPVEAVTDISGLIKIEVSNPLIKVAFAQFQRTETLPGGSGMMG
jgi:hypothetical protein